MAKQINWEYCKDITTQHYIAANFNKCIVNFDAFCKAEGAKKTPFSNEECVNLDKVESIMAKSEKRNLRKTMDAFFGIKLGHQKKIILCEFRLNYKNVNNLSKSELDAKLSNSINIIGHNPMINNCYLFVFNSNLKNQAYRRLRALYSNKKTMQAIDLVDLKNLYFR